MRRIQRQTLIEGWNQDKLDSSFLVSMGKGLASRYAALLGSCIEFGRILHISREQTKDEFIGKAIKRGPVSPKLAEIISQLNPTISIEGYCGPLNSEVMVNSVTSQANAYFHGGNSIEERRYILANFVIDPRQFRESHFIDQQFVFSGGDDHALRVSSYHQERLKDHHLVPQYNSGKPGRIVAIAQASLGLGELVGRIMSLGNPLDDQITLNFWSDKRTHHEDSFDWTNFDPSDKSILVVGEGAIGTIYLEAIFDLGFKTIYGMDYDTISLTNPARSPHYAGKVGRYKTNVAASHFNKRTDVTQFKSMKRTFTEDSKIPKVDLMISAVDGFENQMAIINYSQRHQVPLLLGGCTPNRAHVYAYVPGQTSSMLYQFDFLREAYLSTIRKTHRHCTDPEVEGSNMITTALCGALLAGETINFFSGHPLKGPLSYDMYSLPRLSYVPLEGLQDLGTSIPRFQPLVSDHVQRTLIDSIESILVKGMPFERWYEQEGNLLNKG